MSVYGTNLNPKYNYFEYKGAKFANDTIVKFNEDYLEKYFINDIKNKESNERLLAKMAKDDYDNCHYIYGRAWGCSYNDGIINFILGELDNFNNGIDNPVYICIEMNMDDIDEAIESIVKPCFVGYGVGVDWISGPKNYFKYKGKVYTAGTVVKLKTRNGYIRYGRLSRISDYSSGRTIFDTSMDVKRHYSENTCIIPEEELETQILEIVIPRESVLGYNKPTYPSDWEVDGLMVGWVIYIAAMIFFAIFDQRFVGWILGSIVFFSWRYKKKKEAADYK